MKTTKVVKLNPRRIFWYNVGRFFLIPSCMPPGPWACLDAEFKAMSYEERASIAVDYAVYGTELGKAIKKKIKKGLHPL